MATRVTISPLDLDEVAALHVVLAGVRVLVVGDDPRVCASIAAVLSRANFHVMTSDDGEPAIALAQTARPDIAIVDFNMPTPGLEVVRRLKALYGAAIWVFVLTGEDDENVRTACFHAGADDVLGKPIQVVELRRRLLAASRAQQAYVESRLATERLDRRLAYGAEASAMLAHDLNNGLAVALSSLSFVHEGDQVTGDEADALETTLRTLRRMSGLVSNFVDIARFEDAAVKPACVSTNVCELLQIVGDVHKPNPGSTVTLEIDCALDRTAFFDPALIERVLHNLVGNASRYCKTGTIRLSATSWDPLSSSAVEISVFNTGMSISGEARSRLFLKYGKGSGGLRGFGLYFSRLACEAHGGSIECRDVSDGVCFAFRLPGRR